MAGIFTPTRLYVSAAFGTVAMTTFGLDRAAAVWRFGSFWMFAERHDITAVTGGGERSLVFMQLSFVGLSLVIALVGSAGWLFVWGGVVPFVELARAAEVVSSPALRGRAASWIGLLAAAATVGFLLGELLGLVVGDYGFQAVGWSLAAVVMWFVISYLLVVPVREAHLTAVAAAAGVIR